jgi:tetratricopeptide (TPR) repeat protein
MNRHSWQIGGKLEGRDGQLVVDCHRRLRGPYAGAGSVLRVLVPQIRDRKPELTGVHAIELMSIAPDLRDFIDAPPETLTELATKDERTRLYARTNTGRLAHGVVDLLLTWSATAGRLALAFANADLADPTDQEFLSILLRRAAADQITVTVATQSGQPGGDLGTALARHADPVTAHPPAHLGDPRTPAQLAAAYIWSDGTSPDPAEQAAWSQHDPIQRQQLHDQRAAELEQSGDWSLRLGAIPYHREHGTDVLAALAALREALDHCLFRGFYDAVVDYGLRGQAAGDHNVGMDYWYLLGRTAVAHAALGHSEEAEELSKHVRRNCTVPSVHMVNSYALAMVYTRHRLPERRDHALAKEYINNAIAIASWWPDPIERTFHTVFNHNGLALVEMHVGDLHQALRLVTEGLEKLNTELDSDAFLLHRSVLMHNRANVLLRLGRVEESLADFGAAINADPNYPEYYFDRGGALHRLGRLSEALADYDRAVALALPFWELHYNRAAVRAEAGDLGGAVEDFARVIDLAPDAVDPWVSWVSLLLEIGDLDAASAGLHNALQVHPDDPQLLCARAQLRVEQGQTDQAWADFDRALAADGGLIAALAGRAALEFEAADHAGAIADLSRAIEVAGADPDLLYNRAAVYREAGDWQAAIGDYTRALELPGADTGEVIRQRAECLANLATNQVPA